jgi:hypothetical protein
MREAGPNKLFHEGGITMPDGAPEHGIPSVEATRKAMLEAMHEIVLPGFELIGFDVSATRSWLNPRMAALRSSAQS